MDIDGFGTKLVDQLVTIGLINNVSDIFQLKLESLSNLDRMAEKSAQNVYDYEVEQNDNKREIKLINPDFIQDIDYEVKTAFAS